jgi:hypothetical protein
METLAFAENPALELKMIHDKRMASQDLELKLELCFNSEQIAYFQRGSPGPVAIERK